MPGHIDVALWIIAVCSVLLVLIGYVVWQRLDQLVALGHQGSGHDESARPPIAGERAE